MMQYRLNQYILSTATLLLSSMALAEDKTATSAHSFSGNIAVVSEYISRGNTQSPENDHVAIQAGLDYQHESGFYLGYWGSTLGYSLTDWQESTQQYSGSKAFEHEFSPGYQGNINDDLSYKLGATYYYYYQSDVKTDTWESMLALDYKNFSLSGQTLLADVNWGNKGDTYFLASYSHELAQNFTLNTALGAYYYRDKGDFESELNTEKKFSFRHLTLGLSHPLGDSGATMSMDYIIGGKLRDDTSLKNKLVFGIQYEF